MSLMARIYDPFMAPLERLGLSRWRAFLAGRAEGCVLEIGVGTGLNLPHYRCAERVVAVDMDAGMLRRAGRRAASAPCPVTLVRADAKYLPFGDGAFDTVLTTLTFCSLDQPERVMAEAFRVLRPGGSFRMLEHVRAPQSWLARLQDVLTPAWSRVSGGCHLNRPTLETARAAGFEPRQVHRRLHRLLLVAVLRRP